MREGDWTIAGMPGAQQRSWTSGTNLAQLSSLELGGLPGAVPCARWHTRLVLAEHGLGGVAETTELLVSELMTNAVQASRATGLLLGIWLRLYGRRLPGDKQTAVAEVWDHSQAPPMLTEPGPASEDGRGLLLVQALAADWGWYRPPDWPGKAVWCLIAAPD